MTIGREGDGVVAELFTQIEVAPAKQVTVQRLGRREIAGGQIEPDRPLICGDVMWGMA